MTGLSKCSTCGGEIEPDVPVRQCPRCLLDLGLWCERLPEDGLGADDSVPEWDPGLALPDYEILGRVGRGGMGIVYRARHRLLNRVVALKVLGGGKLASTEALARFRREAGTAARLDHPNIVPIYEVGECEGNPFLVMKFIEGASLAEKMGELALGPLSGPGHGAGADVRQSQLRIARLVAVVARSAHYAHGRGVLHRDIKPANILLDGENQPYLTDFGLAKLADAQPGLTLTAELLGTPSYMSPEQASGRPLSAASDVFSLGVVLYELLTGRRPFDARQPTEVLQQVLRQDPVHPRSINSAIARDLATICLKCLDKEPARRYGSALEMAEDLESWQCGEPIRARPAGPILRARRWIGRNRAVAALIVALVAGLVSTLYFLAKAQEQTSRKAVALATLRTETARQLQEIWASSRPSCTIRSETLAALAGTEPAPLEMGGESWTVAFVPEGNPLDLALGTAPLLQHVERCMSKASGVRAGTRLDMRFYRTQTQAVAALAVGEVDFVEMNAREYVRARSQSPGARLLARPVPSIAAGTWGGGPSVLFTRAGTGINTLSDLRGRSFLFGATDSTLTFWAKVYLEKAGIHAGDLARYRYLDRPENLTGGGSNRGSASRGKPLGNPFSEMTAVAAVVDGTYDAGVATERRVLQVATREKLVVLKRFDDPGSVLVCGNKVPAPAAASFQEALTGLKDPQILQAFPGRPCRFEPCKDADFAAIASRLTPELEFDQSETQEQPSRTNDQHNSL